MRKYSGKKRFIFDMSACHSSPFSLNSLIPSEHFLFIMLLSTTHELRKIAGQDTRQTDITHDFKIVSIFSVASFWDQVEFQIYFVVRLTFSCRISPCIFNFVSEVLSSSTETPFYRSDLVVCLICIIVSPYTKSVPHICACGLICSISEWHNFLYDELVHSADGFLSLICPLRIHCSMARLGSVSVRKLAIVCDNQAVVGIINKIL